MRNTLESVHEPRLSAAVIPTNILCHLVQMAHDRRVESASWFKGMRLDPQEIDDPATRVSYRQATEIVARALAALAQPDLGLVVGYQQDIGNFGLLGLAMRTAPTFGEAIQTGITYQRAIGTLLDVNLETDDTRYESILTARAPATLPAILPFLCEEMFTSSLMLARDLAGPEFRPLRLELTYPAPDYVDRYAQLFQCELHFDQPRNAMVIDKDWMDLKFNSYNPVNSRQVLDLCRLQLHDPGLPQQELAATVERCLRQQLAVNPTLVSIAGHMHLSERTLRRQLAAEGTSFSRLHDRIRMERALELLHDHGQAIGQVGSQLGFTDAREFRRAFKRWTGQTPSEARQRLLNRQPLYAVCD